MTCYIPLVQLLLWVLVVQMVLAGPGKGDRSDLQLCLSEGTQFPHLYGYCNIDGCVYMYNGITY